MSVIIRLQNLPWSANALDIRQYFHGLSIPEGGVHIVGGELGDAFIAFSTDEDARQAFERNNGKIKEVQIKLMLSSRTEMQKVIETARSQTIAAYMPPVTIPVAPAPILQPAAIPPVMQPAAIAMPALVPAAIPSIYPKKDDKDIESDKSERSDKRDRRRSKSRSRDRTDRSRDRDRRDRRKRDRSRSRSRERRDRRRRDRSYSRDRHSKDRERRTSRERRKSDDKPMSSNGSSLNTSRDTKPTNTWDLTVQNIPKSPPNGPPLLNQLPDNSQQSLRAPMAPNISGGDRNSFPGNNDFMKREQDNYLGMPSRFSDGNMPFQRGGPDYFPNDRFESNLQHNNGPFNDSYSGGNGRYSKWPPKNDNHKPFNGRDQYRERVLEQHSDCCIKLHPFYGGFGEVRRFFQGLFIHNSGIKLLNDRNGRRTGWVYVRFVYPDGKMQALDRNGQYLRKQPVEVAHLDDEEFENSVDRYRPPDYIENLDEDMEEDVIEEERPNSFRKHQKHNNDFPNGQKQLQNFTCLTIEDLPSYVKEQDVLKMFSDYSLMSILIVENKKQRKNLLAYVKFSNEEHAKKALEETARHTLDGKHLTVKPCSDEDFDVINRQQNELMGTEDIGSKRNFVKVQSEFISLTGLPKNIKERDITDFFCDVGIVPEKIHLLNSGTAFCEFGSLDAAQSAVSKNGMYLGTSIITVTSLSQEEFNEALGIRSPPVNQPMMNNPPYFNQNPRPFFRNNFNMGPRGGYMGQRPPMRYPGPHKNDNFPPSGCTVLMENVPYKAAFEEILEFFKAFNIPPESVLRRFNPNGQPSGETKVIFNNLEEAQRAVQTLNREKIRDRVVYLSLC